jgi:hypothetical protein
MSKLIHADVQIYLLKTWKDRTSLGPASSFVCIMRSVVLFHPKSMHTIFHTTGKRVVVGNLHSWKRQNQSVTG